MLTFMPKFMEQCQLLGIDQRERCCRYTHANRMSKAIDAIEQPNKQQSIDIYACSVDECAELTSDIQLLHPDADHRDVLEYQTI